MAAPSSAHASPGVAPDRTASGRIADHDSRAIGPLVVELGEASKAAFAAVVGAHGLTATQARTLLSLAEPRPMRELAEVMACDASNITGIADRLGRLGLVERIEGQDRRVKLLTLTGDGQRVWRELNEAISSGAFPIDRLTRAERTELTRLIRKALDRTDS